MTLALYGAVWPGGDAAVIPNGVLLVAGDGTVAALGPAAQVHVPEGVDELRGTWVGPALVDAHVHLAFGTPAAMLNGGVVAMRDLGAPRADARRWRDPVGPPVVAVTGPLLTGPDGYPSRSWGAGGFAAFVDSPEKGRALVRDLAEDGVDLVKVALEPSGGAVPSLDEVRAIVDAAHACGLAVTAHALTEAMVLRALDGGVDELCHTPVEPLGDATVARVAASGVPVVSTIQTLGAGAAQNAAALHAAGVRLVYGTDLGNGGTRPGADERELERLADAGLGRLGALRAATGENRPVGLRNGPTGRFDLGGRAYAVVLDADPLLDPSTWRRVLTTVSGRRTTPLLPRTYRE
jgi:imidazolonepropionase-like amidohydrolase